MKITIDTKEDSPDELRKLIKMLIALIGDYDTQRSAPAEGEHLFDMFGDPAASTSEQQKIANNGGMDINEFIDKAEEPKDSGSGDDVRVIPY